ncbi:MAG TPA: DNA polymerase III subunit beta [Dehalococcoidia bacterium]|nr:DNA polymerase III subunit beta [Dehalococcoidia bacterium]
MKVSCLQENLARGLAVVRPAVASRSTLPITQNVLVTTDGGRLKLAATDLEIALSCWVGARIEEEGTTTVPARLFQDFVNSLPQDQIALTLPARSRTMRLTCARNEATIGSMDADDFPPIPAVQSELALRIDRQALKQAIGHVAFAAATDDSRPVLTGVQFQVEDEQLTLAAADGFRLAVFHLALSEPAPEKLEIIVPARALNELARLLTDEESPVEMMVNANRSSVMFRVVNKDVEAEMVAQLKQGPFPNYGQLIPKAHNTRVTVDAREFLRETKIAAIFARDGSGIVRLQVHPGEELSPGRLQISARAEEIGDNQGEIDAAVEGESSKIAFNSKYLQDVLNVISDGKVALETQGPSQPGVIRPLGLDNYVHVVMPMFVQW